MKTQKNLLKRHLIFFIFISIFSSIVIHPALMKILRGEVFGGDIGQYLVSAYNIVYGKDLIYNYPYPILPLIYVPFVMLFKDPFAQYATGSLLGSILLIFLVITTYLALTSLISNKKHRYTLSTLGCLPVAFYPLYFDAVGWGGQAQILALIFGMLMIKFYVEHRFLRFMSTGVVLLLVHPWTMMFFSSILLVSLVFLFAKQKNVLRERITRLNLIRFILCLVILLGLTFTVLEKEGIDPLNRMPVIEAVINGTLDLDLFIRRLTYSSEFSFLLFFSAFFILSFATLMLGVREKHEPRTSGTDVELTKAAFVTSLIFVLFSPAQYADRGLYLLPIPFSLLLNVLLSRLFNEKSMTSNIFRGDKEVTSSSLLLLSIFLLGCFSGSTTVRYPSALDYYSFPNDLFILPRILKDTNGNVLLITPHAFWFPASGILKANVFTTAQPVWFIQNRQIHYIELANMLAWGNVFASCGKVVIVDSEPLWSQPSPAIFVSDYPYFVELFRLSDGLLSIQWSPASSPETIYSSSLFYANRIISTWDNRQFEVYINHVYEWNSLIVSKEIHFFKDSMIEIKLNYSFINSIPIFIENQLVFLVMKKMGKDLFLDFVYTNDTELAINVTQYFKEPWLIKRFATFITVSSENAVIDSFRFEEMDSWSFLRIRYKPFDTNISSIVISIKIIVHTNVNQECHDLKLIKREEIIKKLNIQYIVLDKGFHEDSLHIIENDPNFLAYTEAGRFIIYSRKEWS